MDFNTCAQCGVEIDGQGIHYRGRSFCSDECCEEFEADFAADDEPDEAALSADDVDDLDDDDLGYRNGDDVEDEYDDDDDYEIKPEDF
jgi:hypothetical protein